MLPVADAEMCLRSWEPRDDGAIGTWVFPEDLPVFAGHFPGEPVLPGVYQLATALVLARRALARPQLTIASIDRSKWVTRVGPTDELRVTVTIRSAGTPGCWRVSGEIVVGAAEAASRCCSCRLVVRDG